MGEIVVNPGAIDALNDRITNRVKRTTLSGTIENLKHYETYYVDMPLNGVTKSKVLSIYLDYVQYNAPAHVQLLAQDVVRVYCSTNNVMVTVGILYTD